MVIAINIAFRTVGYILLKNSGYFLQVIDALNDCTFIE